MRVSTNLFHANTFGAIGRNQSELLNLQEKLITGNRINRASDDPMGQAQVHNLNRTIDTIDQFAKNGQFAKTQLTQQERAVSDTIEITQRVYEIGIQMSNDTYNADQRRTASFEVEQLMQQVKQMMFSKNTQGEYIFSGNNVKDAPYVEDPYNEGFLTYIGNIGTTDNNDNTADYPGYQDNWSQANFGGRFVQIGFDPTNQLDPGDERNTSRVRISDAGEKVFGFESTSFNRDDPDTPYDTDHMPDSNLYNTMELLRRQLAGTASDEEYFGNPSHSNAPTGGVITDLRSAITKMSENVAEIGVRQVRIETQFDSGEAFKMSLQERRMNIQEMDIAEGISKFTMTENALQMAQQVFTRVSQLSLFDYLR